MKIETDGSKGFARVGDALTFRRFVVEVPSGPERWPELEMTLEVIDGRPQCRELTIRSVEGGREVRDSDLSAVKVAQMVEDAFALLTLPRTASNGSMHTFTAGGSRELATRSRREVTSARRARKMTPDFLREVAAVYLEHRSGTPTKAVAERYEVEHRTAALWAKKATDAGFLPPTTPGRRRR